MKQLLLSMFLCVVALPTFSQTVGDNVYIYRNDGQQNKFLRKDVREFSYSRKDAADNQHDDIVTQFVRTADSVYSIPLAAIDSISFVTPIDSVITNQTDFTMFRLVSNTGKRFNSFLIDDDAIHIKVPHDEDLSALRPEFRHNGQRVLVGDSEIASGKALLDFSDFLQPQEFVVESSDGSQKRWTVILYDLPVIIINTPDRQPIVTKSVRTEGCEMTLVDEGGEVQDLGMAGVKGRGNSTWLLPKKPYNIKLDKKHEILGMKSSKHWILLANAYYDRTQLRNAVAFELARMTDYPWVQSGTFVELIMNGRHLGLYYLCEKIRAEKGRIEIDKIAPTDTIGEELTGGYLMESAPGGYDEVGENSFLTDFIYRTGNGLYLHWDLKSPDGDVPYQQMNYIREALNRTEQLILDPDSLATGKYRELFDIESAINWWLVQEATLNEEASRTKNVYMYKERNGKFVVGPPWDFDAWTFGMYGTRHFSCTRKSFYMRYLLEDPVFVERAREKFAKYKEIWMENIGEFIVVQREKILRAAARNEMMWPEYHVLNFANEKSFVESTQEMHGALVDQLLWMEEKLAEGDFSDWDENR